MRPELVLWIVLNGPKISKMTMTLLIANKASLSSFFDVALIHL